MQKKIIMPSKNSRFFLTIIVKNVTTLETSHCHNNFDKIGIHNFQQLLLTGATINVHLEPCVVVILGFLMEVPWKHQLLFTRKTLGE